MEQWHAFTLVGGRIDSLIKGCEEASGRYCVSEWIQNHRKTVLNMIPKPDVPITCFKARISMGT